jgi:GT2 family glycosyltransferase
MDECLNYEVEIIVINDNSTDNTKEYLEKIEGIKLINNPENLGFLKNINKGLKEAKGDYVLLLNNDVVVLPNLLKELFYVFENKQDVGAVGAMAIHPTGLILEASSTIFSNAEAMNNGRLATLENPHYQYIKTADYCSGYCLLIKRLLPNGNLIQLDEYFLPAYYEETDLCMQLRYNHNLHIYYQPFARLIHFESISYGQEKNSKKQALIDKNKLKFREKWKVVLEKNHGLKTKKYRDFNDLSLKEKATLYLQDVINEDTLKTLVHKNDQGEKVTILLKSKQFLDANTIESLQRKGVEVLYPYSTYKGKYRSYFKIMRRLLPAYKNLETKNIFYRFYLFLTTKVFVKN